MGNGSAGRPGRGQTEVGDQALDGPADRLQLRLPPWKQFVDTGVALHVPRSPGGDATSPVARVAGGREVLGDLVRALREDLADRIRDAGDAPVAQVPRGAVVGCDREAQLDGSGGGVEPPDHRRCLHGVAQRGAVEALVAAAAVEHLHDVGHQHVVVGCRVSRPGGAVTGHRVGQPAGGGAQPGPAPPAAAILEPVVQPVHRGGGLDVEDRVHVLGSVDHPEDRHALVGRDHQLEARPSGGNQPLPGDGMAEPADAEGRVVGVRGHLAGQAEAGGAGTGPPQGRLPAGAVVGERCTGVVVAAADDGRLVVGDLVGAHRAEPRHDQRPPGIPLPEVAIVFTIGSGCRAGFDGLGTDRRRPDSGGQGRIVDGEILRGFRAVLGPWMGLPK
jgi:hypothetical protein